MKSTLSNVFIFVAGTAVGSLVTWQVVKKYYEKLANEEIESVIQTFSERKSDSNDGESIEGDQNADQDAIDYGTILREESYADIPEGKEMDSLTKPYVISPDKFGEIDEYDMRTLFYYANGVLTDDEDNPIEDVEGVVGRSSLTHFGEYEDDSVHVRNERYKIDYEILRDPADYPGVANLKPHRAEDE